MGEKVKVLEQEVEVEVQIFTDLLDLLDLRVYLVSKDIEVYPEQKDRMGNKVLQENKEVLALKDLPDQEERLDRVNPKGLLDHLDLKENKVRLEFQVNLVDLERKEKLVMRDLSGHQVMMVLKEQLVHVERQVILDHQVFLVKVDHKDHQDAGYQDNEAFEEETVVKDLQVLKLAKQNS